MEKCIRDIQNKERDCQGDWCGSDGLCDCLCPDSYECCNEMKEKQKENKMPLQEQSKIEKPKIFLPNQRQEKICPFTVSLMGTGDGRLAGAGVPCSKTTCIMYNESIARCKIILALDAYLSEKVSA